MVEKQNATAPGKSDGVDCRLPSDFNATVTPPSLNHQLPSRPKLYPRPNPDKMEVALKDEANAWDIARRVRGDRPHRHISKGEADRLLTMALAALKERGQ